LQVFADGQGGQVAKLPGHARVGSQRSEVGRNYCAKRLRLDRAELTMEIYPVFVPMDAGKACRR
jgi:hypothetical protein